MVQHGDVAWYTLDFEMRKRQSDFNYYYTAFGDGIEVVARPTRDLPPDDGNLPTGGRGAWMRVQYVFLGNLEKNWSTAVALGAALGECVKPKAAAIKIRNWLFISS
ncbi:hypothetical protein PG985_005611 [Apiospora marii]|uniref:Uncharacterized protein n=1 Tax=Apiospora marii TaxID=335849 RepID=A0ABR1RKF2_9PEZI